MAAKTPAAGSSDPVDDGSHTESSSQLHDTVTEGSSSLSSSAFHSPRASVRSNDSSANDPPYVDAISTNDLFYTAQQVAQVGAQSDVQSPGEVNQKEEKSVTEEDEEKKDDKHIYFILEKEEGIESSCEEGAAAAMGDSEGTFRTKTLAMAKVNVAQRAKMFEGGGCGGKALKTENIGKDKLVKPQDQSMNNVGNGIAVGSTSPTSVLTNNGNGAPKAEEDIYEIKFDDDLASTGSGTQSLQSSMGWSGIYEPVAKTPESPASVRSFTYDLAKPLTRSESPRTSIGGCKQGVPRPDLLQSHVPTQQEIQDEYNRLHHFGQPADKTPAESHYNTLDFSDSSRGQFVL
jgi:hypothetical protein